MKNQLLILMFLMATPFSSQGELLMNGGFENKDFQGWEMFGQDWQIGSGKDSHKGFHGAVNTILKDSADEWRGIFQKVPIEEGKHYTGHVWIRTKNIKASESFFEVQFLDEYDYVISQYQSDKMTKNRSFKKVELKSMVAPPHAVIASVRGVVFMKKSPKLTPGFHVFDDFEFEEIP